MRKFVVAALATMVAVPTVVPAPVQAERHYRDREYRGRDYRYEHCKKSSGTTGTIAGGAGGAVLGNVLGGGTLGTVAGGVGGALLGRHLDKKHDAAQNRRNGC